LFAVVAVVAVVVVCMIGGFRTLLWGARVSPSFVSLPTLKEKQCWEKPEHGNERKREKERERDKERGRERKRYLP